MDNEDRAYLEQLATDHTDKGRQDIPTLTMADGGCQYENVRLALVEGTLFAGEILAVSERPTLPSPALVALTAGVATGTCWAGFGCTQARVLHVCPEEGRDVVSAAFELARKEYPYDRRKLAENVLLATYLRDTSAAGIFELLHDHMAPGEYDLVVLDVAQVPLMVLGLASFHEACVRLCADKEAALAFTCPDERFITQEFADVLVHAERERAVAWAARDESATS